ncbi:MAG: HD domain-containing protein [Bacteriovoracaceae bacterium]|nr:HD domain-containing protein [Bacteriovoracaceae bacterium]
MKIIQVGFLVITFFLSLESIGSSDCMKSMRNILVRRHDRIQTIRSITGKIKKVMADLARHDKNTSEHSFAVAQISARMGKRMGFSGLEQSELVFSALIHDIGKLEVPLEILTSNAKLTNKEFTIMKNHVGIFLDKKITEVIGYTDNLTEKKIWKRLKTIASQHHEKYNSKGYIQGLNSNEIEQISQIIALADVWDAMRAKRSYKRPFSLKKTFAIISTGASSGDFNPNLYQTFKKIIIKYEYENLEKLKLKLQKMRSDPKFVANDEYEYIKNMLGADLEYLASLNSPF